MSAIVDTKRCIQRTGDESRCRTTCANLKINTIQQGDALFLLKCLKENSIDGIVTDPPYGLHFNHEKWDKFHDFRSWVTTWATSALDVLKPGGYLLAMGSPRTVHQLASGIEEGGFDIKDMLIWQYAQGFANGSDIGKSLRNMMEKELRKKGVKGKIKWKF